MVQVTDGSFYGTCAEGGQPTTNNPSGGYGTVFRMTPDGALSTLAWFGYTNGAYPFGAMIEATDGNFHGSSEYGGFKVSPSGILTSGDGGGNLGDPTQGTDGYIYVADSGNDYESGGSIYRFRPGTNDWQILYSFDYNLNYDKGYRPSGGLVQASDGKFYGVTAGGGAYGFGTAYKLTPAGDFMSLVSFGGTNIGRWPYGKMLQASDGNLYGLCDAPEQVFKLTLGGALTTFAVFGTNGDSGSNPNGGLIEANDGNFYGTTFEGGYNAGAIGTVFKITPQGHISTIVVFSSNGAYPGSGPMAGLVQGIDGNLYGTCAYGGDYGGGNIFRIVMPGPTLNTCCMGNQLILSWRTNYACFRLQTSGWVNPPNWIDCTNSPAISDNQFWVTNSISGGSHFFRLKE